MVLLAEVTPRGLTAACNQFRVFQSLRRLGRGLSPRERQKRPQQKPRLRPRQRRGFSKRPLRGPASNFSATFVIYLSICLCIYSLVRRSSSKYTSIYFWCSAKLAFAFFCMCTPFFFFFSVSGVSDRGFVSSLVYVFFSCEGRGTCSWNLMLGDLDAHVALTLSF